ncbi:MAG: ABC transporter ATP-binding protein [Bacteroidales bacterium]|nr:ABC transporter ATP-binding protein [Bacteroidales bacterium]
MSDISIQFDHVGKLYRLGLVGTGTLSHDLNRWWQTKVLHHEDPYLRVGEVNDRAHKGNSDYVWALKDITFDVKEGEVVGIIGKNGAGKSTLLKLLSRVTSPTTGTIRARGRIASLLEVGTGFHGELTGRENIYMNGSILGMTRAEINRKLDDIVEFAGVERYIDTPVKRYSSGMTVRLGFAVAAFLDPEILVVDEVLAVGDAEFQKKAIGKMQDVSKGEGRTVLFVSHNMAAIRSLCHRGVVLDNGEVSFDGETEEAVQYYLNDAPIDDAKPITDCVSFKRSYLEIIDIQINGSSNGRTSLRPGQRELDVMIHGVTHEHLKSEIRMIIKKMDGTPMASLVEGRYKGQYFDIHPGEFIFRKRIRLPKYIANGDYLVDLSFNQPMIQDYLLAPNCLTIHVEGFYDQFGNSLYLSKEGLIGLESEDDYPGVVEYL